MGSYDAISIGGGLAGAAFALDLARHGLKVAVIERSRGPHQKVCGDFQSHEGQAIVRSLGLDLKGMGASRIQTFRFVSGRRSAEAKLPFTAAGFSRSALDGALLDAAQDSGAEVLRGVTATGLEADGTGVTVRIGKHSLQARVAALATGKHNVRGWPRRRRRLTAFKIVIEPTAAARSILDGIVQLTGYRGGYAGACLIENGAVSICWLADAPLMDETGGDWRRQLAMISDRSPLFGDLIAGGKHLLPEPVAISEIPFGYMRRDAIAENVYAVGDQLAVIPSFTGDGMSLALTSGRRAARAVIAGEAASAFQCDHLRRIGSQFRWAAMANLAFSTAAARDVSVAALKIAPHLATIIAHLTRTRGFEELPLSPEALRS
jgi:flavin-dependent dehydrogenase